MEHKVEECDQKINDSGYRLSADGLTLEVVTNAALDEHGHFTIPDSVTSIGYMAFLNCTSLTTVHIPEGVTFIGDYAFYGCTSLTTVHIPEGVTFIGERAFSHCTSLTSAHIPEGVTYIGNCAFHSCTSLTTVHIPEGVTSIGVRAFLGCTRLTTVHIPEGVTSIEYCAFSYCTSLTNVIIDTNDEDELNRIKNLLPENLRDKVISRSVYEILRGMVDRFIFEAAGGAHFDYILCSLGLTVMAVNKIIASYLPGPVGRILGIIDRVGIPACLPNDASKINYRELLAQSIGIFFPTRLLTHEEVHEVENQDVIHDHHADEKESPVQDQQGSPALFQPVVPTRGRRGGEETNVCCVMQ